MNKVKINTEADYLKELDVLGEEFLRSKELMELIVNGATLMSVSKDALRGIIRVILMGAATEVTASQSERDTLKKALEFLIDAVESEHRNGKLAPHSISVRAALREAKEAPNAK